MEERPLKRLEPSRLLHRAGFLPRGLRRKLRVARRVRSRALAALLAVAVGVGVDSSVRHYAGQDRACFGCSTWSCVIVSVADNPLAHARSLWYELTD